MFFLRLLNSFGVILLMLLSLLVLFFVVVVDLLLLVFRDILLLLSLLHLKNKATVYKVDAGRRERKMEEYDCRVERVEHDRKRTRSGRFRELHWCTICKALDKEVHVREVQIRVKEM